MVYNFFDKKLEYTDKTSGGPIKNVIMSNQQLRNELHKTINWKFKKCKIYTSFRDIIWGDSLADMQFIHEYNKEIRFL